MNIYHYKSLIEDADDVIKQKNDKSTGILNRIKDLEIALAKSKNQLYITQIELHEWISRRDKLIKEFMNQVQ